MLEVVRPAIERFLAKISISDSSCWNWTASKNHNGYGQININCKMIRSHRFIFEYYYNVIINSTLEIDHLCRNTSCVNPEHLEVVTNLENVQRGLTGKINHHNSKKTHCLNDHEFNKENTYISGKGSRECRVCHKNRERQRKRMLKINE